MKTMTSTRARASRFLSDRYAYRERGSRSIYIRLLARFPASLALRRNDDSSNANEIKHSQRERSGATQT